MEMQNTLQTMQQIRQQDEGQLSQMMALLSETNMVNGVKNPTINLQIHLPAFHNLWKSNNVAWHQQSVQSSAQELLDANKKPTAPISKTKLFRVFF